MLVFVNLGLECWDIVYKLHVFDYFYLILHKNKLYLFIRVKHAIWKYLHEHTQVCIINKWMDFTFLFFIPTNWIFYFFFKCLSACTVETKMSVYVQCTSIRFIRLFAAIILKLALEKPILMLYMFFF